MKYKMDIRGIEVMQRKLGRPAANRLKRRIGDDVLDGVERMMEEAHDNAPIETGALKQSILASLRKEGDMEYIFGSILPYARRQEYEHNGKIGGDSTPKKFYFRRAIIKEAPLLHQKIGFTVRRVLR